MCTRSQRKGCSVNCVPMHLVWYGPEAMPHGLGSAWAIKPARVHLWQPAVTNLLFDKSSLTHAAESRRRTNYHEDTSDPTSSSCASSSCGCLLAARYKCRQAWGWISTLLRHHKGKGSGPTTNATSCWRRKPLQLGSGISNTKVASRQTTLSPDIRPFSDPESACCEKPHCTATHDMLTPFCSVRQHNTKHTESGEWTRGWKERRWKVDLNSFLPLS